MERVRGKFMAKDHRRRVVPKNRLQREQAPDFTAEDVRFTTKGNTPLRLCDGHTGGDYVIQSLATNSPQEPGKILDVQLLGYHDKLRWKQDKQGLQVRMPAANLSDIGVTFKVTLA